MIRCFTAGWIAMGLLASAPLQAQTTNTYTGPGGGLWGTATNWSLGAVPTSSDNVWINSNTTVNLSSNGSAAAMTLSGHNARLNILGVSLAATGITMTGTNGNSVPIYMDGGTMTLNGGLGSINTSGGVTSLLHINGPVTLNLASANLTYLWLKSGGGAPSSLTISNGQTLTAAVTYLVGIPTIGQSTLNLNGGTLHAGTMIFNATAGSYTNTFNLNSGTLTADVIRREFDGLVTTFNFNDGTLASRTNADLTISRGANATQNMVISLAATGTHNFQAETNRTITVAPTAVLADKAAEAGTLVKAGAGNMILAGTNTYTGWTTINAGTLSLTNGAAIADAGVVTLANISGVLLAVNSSETIGSLRGGGANGGDVNLATGQTLTVVETGNQTFIGRILGSGALAKSGAGSLTLQNSANSFTGGVTVHGGTFRTLGNSAGSNIVVNSGATLAMAGTDTWGAAPVTSTPLVTINSGGTMTSDGQFNSLRDLTLNGGTVKLNGGLSNRGAFAWGGAVTASGALTSTVTATTGTNNYLRLGRQGTAESTTFHVGLASGRLEVGVGLMNNFGATSGLNKTGDGSLVLTGTNGFTGTTTVSGGSLVVSQAAWTATILPNSITAQFSATPATGVYEILPGPLASPSLAAQSVTGLGSGQTGTLTNSPNLRLVVAPSLPANAKPMVNPGQTFHIAETSAAGTRVGTILATDSDSAAVSLGGWTIISGNTGNMFGLNWSTGELTVQGALDYETRSTYTLAVAVSDGRATSDPVNVTVEVDNVAEFADGFGSSAVATELHAAGIPNLAAYALGAMNANSAVTLPVQAMNTSNSATYLTLTALVRTNDPRGQLRGNATTNLNQWPSNPSIAGVPTADQTGAAPGTTQRQLFRVECGADTKKFLRLEAGIAMAQSSPLPDPPSIQAQIEAAVAAGQGQVRIQPGVYTNIVPTGINPHVRLAGIRDLDIDATGVVLVGSRLSRAIFIRDCTNVTLRGLTIDYAPLPMTQGTIEGFGPSREWTDVRIHPGYPSPGALTSGWSFLWASDPLTRRIKPGIANRPNQSITDMGGGVWRVAHGVSINDSAAVGDFLRIPQPVTDNTALVANRNSNLTLSNVTVYSSPFHFGATFGWNDCLTLQSCRIVPGANPAGATEPRLFSAVGDGFHVEINTGGLRILDCETDSTGDDGIAVYDLPLLVGAVADGGKTITLSFAVAGGTDSRWAKRPAAGTRFRFYVAATGTIEEGLVTNRTASTLTSAAWLALRNQLVAGTTSASMFNEPFVVQLQNAVSAAPGDEARMLDDPFETVIRGCRVRNSGSRGIVANTSRVRVENNQIEDTLLPAVHIMADTKEGGPGFQDDISIRSNSITRGNLSRSTSSDYLGSISVVNWDTNRPTFGGHRRVTIENNTIAESWGVDVQVHTATNVIVRGNRFVDSHRLSAGNGSPRPVDNTAAIFLQDVRTAVVESNQLVRPGPYFGAQPLSTQGVTDLQAGQAFVP